MRRTILQMIGENSAGVAFRVLVLARAHGPDEGAQAQQADADAERSQEQQEAHGRFPATVRRSALRVTARDEPDIARAAMKGLTKPAIAAGVATRL